MAVAHKQLSVTVSATNVLANLTDTKQSGNVDRSIILQNTSPGTVYLGGPGVTTGIYGYKLSPNGEIALDLLTHDVLYAVAETPCIINLLVLGL